MTNEVPVNEVKEPITEFIILANNGGNAGVFPTGWQECGEDVVFP